MHRIFVVVCALILSVSCQEETDDATIQITSELELLEMDLGDYCEDMSTVERSVSLRKSSYKNKIHLEVSYAIYLRNQSRLLSSKYPEDDVPYELLRNYTFMVKPGDALLTDNDTKTLINFSNKMKALQETGEISCDMEDCKMSKQEYLNHLAASRDLSSLEVSWSKWQEVVAPHEDEFRTVLQLLPKAAHINNNYNVKAYWEYLTEYENAYATAKTMWDEIEPLYRKLHQFVLIRINKRYGTNFTNVPVYLTGSNFGEDWSNVADIILPHPQLHHDVVTFLERKTIQDIHRLSETTAGKLGLGKFGRKFWTASIFNSTECSPKILSFCSSKFPMMISCDKVDWFSYLTAHETSIEVALSNQDYQALPRERLRYSILDEAVSSMGSIFAVHNLPIYGAVEHDRFSINDDYGDNKMTGYLLLALRILPKLAYYMAADAWRLEELENPSDDIKNNWWELRKRYQGVEGVTNFEADFLGDNHITSNKPYLSKFLGLLLQFQILGYHQIVPFDEANNLAERLADESDFKTLLQERHQRDSLNVLSFNYGISEMSQYPLVEFFGVLDEYFANASLEQVSIIHKKKSVVTVDLPIEVTITAEPSLYSEEEVSIQSDEQQIFQVVQNEPPTGDDDGTKESSIGIYVGVTIGACLLIVLVVVGFKKLVRRKPKTNNRRFEA